MRALQRRVLVSGAVLDCCGGMYDGVSMQLMTTNIVQTNDICPTVKSHSHEDCSTPSFWASVGSFDWVVTSPPFKLASSIVPLAVEAAKIGVAMRLRLDFLEASSSREWIKLNPPCALVILPRRLIDDDDKCVPTRPRNTEAWFVWASRGVRAKDVLLGAVSKTYILH